MEETFYSILDVSSDADEETIRRAYRAHVKETHPDVSDDPGATDTFKRLTTARDVLLDPDERALYDRIGHDLYVSQHVESPVWTVRVTHTDSPGDHTRHTNAASGPTSRTTEEWWENLRQADSPDETWTWSETRTRQRRSSVAQKRHTRSDGGYANESWQTASDVYTRTENTDPVEPTPPLRELLAAVLSLGPWLVVHLVLFASTLATVGFVYNHFVSDGTLSLFVFTGAVLLMSLVLALSALHIAVQVYVNR